MDILSELLHHDDLNPFSPISFLLPHHNIRTTVGAMPPPNAQAGSPRFPPISDGARQFRHRRLHQTLALVLQPAKLLYLPDAHIGIGIIYDTQ